MKGDNHSADIQTDSQEAIDSVRNTHTHTLTVIQKANREYRPYRHKDNHTHRDKPNIIMMQTAIQRYKQPHTNMSRIDTHKQLNRDK